MADLMPLAAAELDFSSRIMMGLIVVSMLSGLLIIAWGALRRYRLNVPQALPPLRPGFPQMGDQWMALAYALTMLLFAATALRGGNSTGTAASMTVGAALFTLAWQAGLYLPVVVRYGLLPRPERPRLPWWKYLLWPAVALGCTYLAVEGLGALGFYDWLIETTGCPEQQAVVTRFSEGKDMLLRTTLAISAVVIAPITEECCFRGFLYSTLRHWGGRVAATLASAAVFAAVHASLAQFVPLFIFGVVLAIAYEKARSLWLPIAVHGIFNGITLITLIYLS